MDRHWDRPVRQRRLPARLGDYILEQHHDTSSVASSSSHMERLMIERDGIRDDIDRYCMKADTIVSERGSRSTLKRLERRLEQSFRELRDVTSRILDSGEDAFPWETKTAVNVLSVTKQQIEDCQDQIAEDLEEREGHGPPSEASHEKGWGADEVEGGPIPMWKRLSPEIPLVTEELPCESLMDPTDFPVKVEPEIASESEEDCDSCSQESISLRSKEARIKAKVASLRVKQEKQRYGEECQLKEAKRTLLLKKREDEAERAKLESKLWEESETTEKFPIEEEKPLLDRPIPLPRTSTQRRGQRVLEDEEIGNGTSPDLASYGLMDVTPIRPTPRPRTSLKRDESEELRRFFQGLAKPSLPEFSGQKGQYQDWWEQFEVFVDQTDVPVRFKMIMLKKSLSGTPLDLVARLGYTEVQYRMAIEKLETRYGGEKRLLQQHVEAIMSVNPLKEDNLKGLADFANKLYDIVAKLKDGGQESELVGTSALYTMVIQKMPDPLLIQFHNTRPESSVDGLDTFVKWLNRQVSIRLEMAEIKEPMKKHRNDEHSKSSPVKGRKDNRGSQKSQSHASEAGPVEEKKITEGVKQAGGDQKPPSTPSPSPKPANNCPLCKEKHPIQRCKKWTSATVPQRWKLAKEQGVCYRCLKLGHRGSSCEFTGKCGIEGCQKTHHRSLHNSSSTEPKKGTSPTAAVNAFGIGADGRVTPTRVALRVLPVYLIGRDGCKRKVNAFLDDGSDSSYVRAEIARSLGLVVEKNDLTISTLVNCGTQVPSGLVSLTIESLDGETKRVIGARTLDSMCEGLSAPDWQTLKDQWKHLKGIEFPKIAGQQKIDVLIGSDHPELILSLAERIGQPGEPVARKTPLGWTCIGSIDSSEDRSITNFAQTHCSGTRSDLQLDEELRRLWSVDVVSPEVIEDHTAEEKAAVTKASESIVRTGGRYQIGIPWKRGRPSLPDNRSAAERRLRTLENGLRKKPQVAERYKAVFDDNIKKGYIREVEPDEIDKPGWYLPHFGVIREDRATTKVRVVYDGAALYDGKSLNDEMLPGPKLQLDVFDILVMFRRGAVALVGDVKEMFSQIMLAPEDRPYHRILWRDLDSKAPIRTYEAVRLPFGDRASPFLAQYVVRVNAEAHKDEYPLAAETCQKRMYMDDAIDSLDTPDDVKSLLKQLKELLGQAGLDIRKWCSNSREVLQEVPEEDRALSTLELEDRELPCVKALGVKWDAERDILGYSHSSVELETVNKRTLLSLIARLFDPLQLLAPFVIRAKMMLQQAWMEGLSWDERFPSQLEEQVLKWVKELPLVAQFEVPRCYKVKAPVETALHTFTDASSLAYGAVTYIRNVYSDGSVTVRIVVAKARVAPLKSLSIPRLELMAAVVGLRLALRTKELLGLGSMWFWTDSMDIIHWLRGQSRHYKPFVSHRIAEIQDKSNPAQWRHVPGRLNPADLPSRGAAMEELISESTWVEGPQFLKQGEEAWPAPSIQVGELSDPAQAEVSRSKVHSSAVSTGKVSTHPESPIDCSRYSKWSRLVRVTAWVLRVPGRLRGSNMPKTLTVEEISGAEKYWIRQAQLEGYAEVIHGLKEGRTASAGRLAPLNPFLDEEGLLRIGGRLQDSDLPYDARHPLIIPPRSHIATLIIRRAHGDIGRHSKGVNATLADLRSRYWIVHGREEVKRTIRECIICARQRKRGTQQIMAPLPAHRVTIPIRPFARSGVDYGGPYIVKLTRNTTAKRWLCLFTCTTSRAVHLEVAFSLDTDSFLNAFSRMVARRGKPEVVVSDNGTNFVSADKELNELLRNLDQDRIVNDAANRGITWRFNPPWGSHHGGLFEALIKSAKKALRMILGEARITDEELQTAIVEIEGLMNSRPLTYCSDDTKDEEVLTPNHFLMGQCGGQLAPRVVEETACNPRQRWRYVQDLISRMWRRWNKEFLTLLQRRGKWLIEREDLKTDDVVLVADPTNPRGRWPLGRIVEVLPCSDGHVRSVRVLSGGKTFIRPISRLCKLDVSSKIDDLVVGASATDHGGEDVVAPPPREPP